MITSRIVPRRILTGFGFLLVSLAGPAAALDLQEPPFFESQVSSGALPPVTERAPAVPAVAGFAEGQRAGVHGGEMTILMSRAKDVRQMVVYGYARLVAYDESYELVPDILESVAASDDATSFTLHLRPGHKWSDGAPFTTEDFRYYWEDVALNEELSPVGPPSDMIVDGEMPQVEIIDETTVRYSWPHPYPDFLTKLARPRPLYLYKPSHYLKKYHNAHAGPEAIAKLVEESGQRNWAALHNSQDNQYKNDNPALPTLQPWVLKTEPPSERFVFQRNPYYHRVDSEGRQLPYIDQVTMAITGSGLIPAKAGTGGSDLQARYLSFDDYTFLREGSKDYPFQVNLWRTAKGGHIVLYPNLNANDEVWRAVLRDARFRQALSLGINRHEINRSIYFGLALEAQNTMLPKSPLYRKTYAEAFTAFDVAAANELLDAMGLTARTDRGMRKLPDGRPMELIVETAGESTEQTDVLQLIHDTWRQLGIKLYIKPLQRDTFRNRIFAGDTLMSIWTGYENGLATPSMSPEELAPTNQQQLMWPKWGEYHEAGGDKGAPIDMALPQRLHELAGEWRTATSKARRSEIWHEMLSIHAEQLYSIGVIAGVLQPVVVASGLMNVPKEGIYNWDPGSHFGVYRPDLFWFDPAVRGDQRASAN